MPSSRQARMTRIAISPRFATRTLLKSLLFNLSNGLACLSISNGPASCSTDREQRLVRRHDLALLDVNRAHLAGDGGDDVVLHLHRLEHRDDIAELHGIARLHGHLDDETLHRCDHGSFTDPGRWRR